MKKVIVVVEDGRVTDVFSNENCDVEIIDLDINDSYDEKEELEHQVDEIRNSIEYKCVY